MEAAFSLLIVYGLTSECRRDSAPRLPPHRSDLEEDLSSNDVNSYDHPTSSAPKDVHFLFFCSTTLVLFCVLLINGHLTKLARDAQNAERMKLLFMHMAGNSGIIVSLPVFFVFS